MTPQEKALIDSVFDRLAQTASAPKDAEALTYINDHAAKLPDAPYGLVQAVLIQEMALNHASTRIAQLEHAAAQAGAPAPGSSFLGAATAGAAGSGPWGTRAAPPQAAPLPQYQAPPPQPQYQPQPAAGSWGAPTGGGFLRNIAGMAAGVAGGTLLAEGIASLFGGRHLFGSGYGSYGGLGGFGGLGGGPWGGQPGMVENVTVNNYGDANAAAAQDGLPQTDDVGNAGYQDAGNQDPSFDDPSGGDSGGFDDGGGSDFTDV